MIAAISFAAKHSMKAAADRCLVTMAAARYPVTMADLKRSKSINLPTLSIQEMPRIYQRMHEIFQRQSKSSSLLGAINGDADADACRKKPQFDPMLLEEAYQRCRRICAENSKSFYLGTLVLSKERQRALWAIYAWCRRTDDLVDGPSVSNTSMDAGVDLDGWGDRLEDIFRGQPHDMLDAALVHTIFKFCLDIGPFKDMIEGMRMDLRKKQYANFKEFCVYSYHCSATVGLMTIPVFGIAAESPFPAEKIYHTAFYLGIAGQMTNVLRDVAEDALRGRVYLPQDELAQFGLSNEDVFSKNVSHGWREFMKEQIKRARFYWDLSEEGASQFHNSSRWTIWSYLVMHHMILDEIEHNHYDNLTKHANVGRLKKLLTIPLAYFRAS